MKDLWDWKRGVMVDDGGGVFAGFQMRAEGS